MNSSCYKGGIMKFGKMAKKLVKSDIRKENETN